MSPHLRHVRGDGAQDTHGVIRCAREARAASTRAVRLVAAHRTNFCGSQDAKCQKICCDRHHCVTRPPARGDGGASKVHSDTTSARACPRPLPWSRRGPTTTSSPRIRPRAGRSGRQAHRLAVRNHRFFAGFAAAKYTKHGPGALFVFGNSGLEHTLAEEGDGECTRRRRRASDRRCWCGGDHRQGRGRCALEDFTKGASRWTATLRRSVRTGATGPRSRSCCARGSVRHG